MAVFTATVAPRAASVIARWDLDAVLNDHLDLPFNRYQAWLDTVKTPENSPALFAADPPPAGRFALMGLREDGYREYGFL